MGRPGHCLTCGRVTGKPRRIRCLACFHDEFARARLEGFFSWAVRVGECLEWTGTRNPHGYGRFSRRGRQELAHRVAYELAVGPIPDGLQVLHRCDNPPCVNPTHLWLGTPADNAHDRDTKGRRRTGISCGLRNGTYTHPERRPRGDRNGRRTKPESILRGDAAPWAILTEATVRQIRVALQAGQTHRSLGAEYGVTRSAITRLARALSWRHVA